MKIKLCFQDRTFILDVEPLSTVKELSILAEMVIDFHMNLSIEAYTMLLEHGTLAMNGTLKQNGVKEDSVIKLSLHQTESLSVEQMISNLLDRLDASSPPSMKIAKTEFLQLFHNDPILIELDLSTYLKYPGYSETGSKPSNGRRKLLKLLSMGLRMNTNLTKIKIHCAFPYGKSNSF
jgi:hypothetical protein